MRIFIDTEFVDTGDLIFPISVAAVRADGAEYYAEHEIADKVRPYASRWVQDNVYPHLVGADARRSAQDLRADLRAFFGKRPEVWGDCPSYDWILLSQLFGTMMDRPAGWPFDAFDIRQLAAHKGVSVHDGPQQIGTEHYALADARWTRDVWCWLDGLPWPQGGAQ